MQELFNTLISDPAALILNFMRIFHFIGLACGIGAATLLDLLILRYFVGKRITVAAADIFQFGTGLVSFGMYMLWFSGFGFLVYYAAFEPVKLTNEKVWAKMLIMIILTINGILIHRSVLPMLLTQIGKSIFQDLDMRKRQVLVTVGIISIVSWYGPLIIANLSSLNYQVPALHILQLYALVLCTVLGVVHLIFYVMYRPGSGRARAYKSAQPLQQARQVSPPLRSDA